MRVRVKSFQSEEFDQMSFQEIDDFVEALIQIEAKLPYLVSSSSLFFFSKKNNPLIIILRK